MISERVASFGQAVADVLERPGCRRDFQFLEPAACKLLDQFVELAAQLAFEPRNFAHALRSGRVARDLSQLAQAIGQLERIVTRWGRLK